MDNLLALYIEQTSIVAKIGAKSYWLMNADETNEAIKELNRLLTQPIPSSGETDDGETAGDEGGAGDAGDSSDTEMEPEEPAEDELA
jgi:hypothetical protein